MKLAIITLIIGCIIWVNFDSQAKHVVATETAQAKDAVLTATCPPANGSTVCHLLAELLYDPDDR